MFKRLVDRLKNPLSHRAQEDARQTELIRRPWADNGKVYGYRKLTDDLRDQDERIADAKASDVRDAIIYDGMDILI